MKVYGLIGFPLSHSFSKRFFTQKFNDEGLTNLVYENFELSSIADFSHLISNTTDLEGLNVTIPYKEQVIPFLHWKHEVVHAVGACNCIRIKEEKLYGYNTDTLGFEQSLATCLLPRHRKALVLGTGGAAKAVAYVLGKLDISFFHVSRNAEGSGSNTIRYEEITNDMLHEYTLIINTTPLGMYPRIDSAPPLNYAAMTSQHYLFDLVYNPEKTVFLQKGEERGATVQNGHKMLIIQAEESWKIWNEGQ